MTATATNLESLDHDADGVEVPPPELRAIVVALRERLGRPVEVRGDEELVIELDVPGAYAGATWKTRQGRLVLEVLAEDEASAGVSSAAVSELLRRTSRAVRGVEVDDEACGFEVELDTDDDRRDRVEALAEAARALTVAARFAMLEAQALADDPELARRFLV